MKIKITAINDCPTVDNYSHGLTFARIYLYENDDQWFVSIDQDEDMDGTPSEWYFNTAGIRERLEFTPSSSSARKFLSSEKAQRLLTMVVESFSVEWDGNNHVGDWDDEPWQELIALLHEECVETEWTHYTTGEYYEMYFPLEKLIKSLASSKSFDKTVQDVSEEETADQEAEKIFVEGDLAEFFEKILWEKHQDFVLENVSYVDTDFLTDKVIEFANQYADYEGDDLDEAKAAIAVL